MNNPDDFLRGNTYSTLSCVSTPSEPEHASMALQIANEITSGRFSPDEENQILFLIIETVKERRKNTIVEVEKQAAYLKDTYDKLVTQK